MTESITLIAASHSHEDVIEDAAAVFSPEELSHLVYAIIEINAWNRLAIATGAFAPGSYEPGQSRA